MAIVLAGAATASGCLVKPATGNQSPFAAFLAAVGGALSDESGVRVGRNTPTPGAVAVGWASTPEPGAKPWYGTPDPTGGAIDDSGWANPTPTPWWTPTPWRTLPPEPTYTPYLVSPSPGKYVTAISIVHAFNYLYKGQKVRFPLEVGTAACKKFDGVAYHGLATASVAFSSASPSLVTMDPDGWACTAGSAQLFGRPGLVPITATASGSGENTFTFYLDVVATAGAEVEVE